MRQKYQNPRQNSEAGGYDPLTEGRHRDTRIVRSCFHPKISTTHSKQKGSPIFERWDRIRRVYYNLHPHKLIQCNIFSTETVVSIMAKRPLLYSLFGNVQITFTISLFHPWTKPLFLNSYLNIISVHCTKTEHSVNKVMF